MKDIIQLLVETEMREIEAKVYYGLLRRHNSTAQELSKNSGLSETAVLAVLNKLTVKGFCFIRFYRSDIIYSVIDPEIALKEIISRQKELLNRKQSTVHDLSRIYNGKH